MYIQHEDLSPWEGCHAHDMAGSSRKSRTEWRVRGQSTRIPQSEHKMTSLLLGITVTKICHSSREVGLTLDLTSGQGPQSMETLPCALDRT